MGNIYQGVLHLCGIYVLYIISYYKCSICLAAKIHKASCPTQGVYSQRNTTVADCQSIWTCDLTFNCSNFQAIYYYFFFQNRRKRQGDIECVVFSVSGLNLASEIQRLCNVMQASSAPPTYCSGELAISACIQITDTLTWLQPTLPHKLCSAKTACSWS